VISSPCPIAPTRFHRTIDRIRSADEAAPGPVQAGIRSDHC
jgi:hypothetical protein